MRFLVFAMDSQTNHDQNRRNSGSSFPPYPYYQGTGNGSYQQQADFGSFGGVRHGFNAPDMRYAHHSHGISGITAPFPTLASTAYPNIRGPQTPLLPAFAPVARSHVLHSVHSVDETNQLTTPPVSRRVSLMHGVLPINERVCDAPTEGVCVCNTRNEGRSTQDLDLATNAYNRAQSFSRLPINQLLNPQAATTSQRLPPITTRPVTRSQATGGDMNAASRQGRTLPTSMSICSNTTDSSLTVRPAIVVSEERLHLLNTLYETCQSATLEYISAFPLVHRHSKVTSRHHPYATPASRPGAAAKKGKEVAATLMDNISKISTRIWRRARRDLVAPHREEADAVKDMRDLYKWAEVVARSMESDGLETEAGDADHTSDISGTQVGRGHESGFAGMRVARAAKKICQWVGDEEAWDTCENIMSELRGLVEDDGSPTFGGTQRGWDSESIV